MELRTGDVVTFESRPDVWTLGERYVHCGSGGEGVIVSCGSGTGTGTGSAPATDPVVEPLSWESFETWYERWRRTVLTRDEHEAAERAK